MREVNLKWQTAGEEYSLCEVCLQQPLILSEVQVKSLVNPAYVFSGQVLAELPKKIIQVEVCPMVPTQQIFYQELKASLHRNKDLKGSSLSKNTMSALMELRKLANHPLLMRRLYTNEKLKEMSKLMLRVSLLNKEMIS